MQFLTAEDLVKRWNGAVIARTLANWRTQGKGPKFRKIGGKVRYHIDDVVEWEESRRVSSTAEFDKLD